MDKSIRQLVTARKLEDVELIEKIEDILIKKRGYVFKMPRKGSSVVVSMSGGADTTITTAILLKDYQLNIYPYYIKRGARAEKFEEESIDFFSNLFKKRYPKLFNKPKKFIVPVPALEIKKDLPLKIRQGFGYPLRNSIMLAYGVQYAKSLSISQEIDVHTVFASIVSGDADYTMHSTLTTLRSFMLHVCMDMGDWNWQVSSLPVETAIGNYYDKDILIKRAEELKLPLEKTRTCVKSSSTHCGVCPSCHGRKESFEITGVIDKTKYLNNCPSTEINIPNTSNHEKSTSPRNSI